MHRLRFNVFIICLVGFNLLKLPDTILKFHSLGENPLPKGRGLLELLLLTVKETLEVRFHVASRREMAVDAGHDGLHVAVDVVRGVKIQETTRLETNFPQSCAIVYQSKSSNVLYDADSIGRSQIRLIPEVRPVKDKYRFRLYHFIRDI